MTTTLEQQLDSQHEAAMGRYYDLAVSLATGEAADCDTEGILAAAGKTVPQLKADAADVSCRLVSLNNRKRAREIRKWNDERMEKVRQLRHEQCVRQNELDSFIAESSREIVQLECAVSRGMHEAHSLDGKSGGDDADWIGQRLLAREADQSEA